MHDRVNTPIKVGDKVVIVGTVTGGLSNDGTFCSVEVQIDGDWDGKGGTNKNWFAAKQVLVVGT